MVLVVCLAAVVTIAEPTSVDIGGSVYMPRVNLGTCCGSNPAIGVGPWFQVGGVGIDTAWDYGNQASLGQQLRASGKLRDSYFVTSKVPAGDHMPGSPGIPGACSADPNASLAYVRASLKTLGITQLDLVLIHSSCANYDPPVADPVASDNALWQGLVAAKKLKLTRAIGVSNFNAAQLKTLVGETPAVNQLPISILPFWGLPSGHDDVTLSYCAAHGITPESYGSLRGCPFSDSRLAAIATAHQVSPAQVCLRWVLQRGAIIATGTGSNATTAPVYSKENLDVFGFSLSANEMRILNNFNNSTTHHLHLDI